MDDCASSIKIDTFHGISLIKIVAHMYVTFVQYICITVYISSKVK